MAVGVQTNVSGTTTTFIYAYPTKHPVLFGSDIALVVLVIICSRSVYS